MLFVHSNHIECILCMSMTFDFIFFTLNRLLLQLYGQRYFIRLTTEWEKGRIWIKKNRFSLTSYILFFCSFLLFLQSREILKKKPVRAIITVSELLSCCMCMLFFSWIFSHNCMPFMSLWPFYVWKRDVGSLSHRARCFIWF